MDIWLAAVIAMVVFTFAVYRIKIYIELVYTRQDADDQLLVRVWLLYHLIEYQMEVPMLELYDMSSILLTKSEIEVSDSKISTITRREKRFLGKVWGIFLHRPRKWHAMLRQFSYYSKLYAKMMNRLMGEISCERIVGKTRVGVGDPALTSLVVGLMWAAIGHIYLLMHQRLKDTAKPSFHITPDFRNLSVDVKYQCIISVRVGNVINAILTFVNFPLKEATDSGRTSYTEFDENGNGKH
ncbi:MAG: hypothetical protein H6Q73_1102 [Firmicutes bacterium]|nr:hypothetical protein [Bacillota bacterium]